MSDAIPQWDSVDSKDEIRFHAAGQVATPRAPRQTFEARALIIERARFGIGALVEAEISAGWTAREEIARETRLYNASQAGKDRRATELRCLGQRNGLLRVMQDRAGEKHLCNLTAETRKFLDIALALSANASAVSGSGWTSTQTWLSRNLPWLLEEIGPTAVKSEFDQHLARANAILAARIPIRLADYRTSPSAIEIAETLEITIAELREARANRVGLTSIDPESKRDRDRRNAEAKRRAAGMQAQAERTRWKDDIALAAKIGVSHSTIRRWRKKGIFDSELEKRMGLIGGERKVSPG